MATFGEAIVKFVADTTGLTKTGTAEAEEGGQSAGAGFGKAFSSAATAATAAFAAIQIGKFAGDVLAAGEELHAAISRSNAIFGQNAEQVQAWSDTTVTSMGLASSESLAYANSIGNVLVNSFGMSTQAAGQMSEQVVSTAADLAAFKQVPVGDAVNAVTKAMEGQTRGLKSLGIDIDATSVKQKAYQMGLAQQGQALTQAQTAEATYALIVERSSSAHGYAAKSLQTYQGEQKVLTATVKQAEEEFGSALLPIMTKLATMVTSVLAPAVQRLTTYFSQNQTALTIVASILAVVVAGATALATIIAVVSAAQAVWTAATAAWTVAQTIATAAAAAFNAVMALNPIVLIVIAIIALIAILILLYNRWTPFRDLVNTTWAAIQAFVSGVITWFSMLPALVGGVFSAIGTFLSGFIAAIGGALGAVISFVVGAISWWLNLQVQAASIVAGMVGSVLGWFGAMVAGAVGAMASLVAQVVSWLSNLLGQVIGLAGRIGTAISAGFQAAVGSVAGAISSIGSAVINGLSGLVGQAAQLGGAIVQGLVNGILGSAGSVGSALQSIATNALNAAKAAVGASSPAKAFIELGNDMVSGLVIGLQQQQPTLNAAIGNLMPTPSVTAVGTPAAASLGGPALVINQATFSDDADLEALSRKMEFATSSRRF
jgi:hypothetical protein